MSITLFENIECKIDFHLALNKKTFSSALLESQICIFQPFRKKVDLIIISNFQRILCR